jgi:hypothetical protein
MHNAQYTIHKAMATPLSESQLSHRGVLSYRRFVPRKDDVDLAARGSPIPPPPQTSEAYGIIKSVVLSFRLNSIPLTRQYSETSGVTSLTEGRSSVGSRAPGRVSAPQRHHHAPDMSHSTVTTTFHFFLSRLP